MKKLTLLLLLIPLVSFGQIKTLNDLLKINNLNQFKRICIENGYEKNKYQPRDNMVEYYLNPTYSDNDVEKAEGAAIYYTNNNNFRIMFYKTPVLGVNLDYESIFDEVKNECEFYDITTTIEGNDYSTYSCTLIGKYGFREDEGWSNILYFVLK